MTRTTTQRRLIIVGCGKAKLPHAAAARDLYTGQLFRAARAYAERFGDAWCIASAKHGVVQPDAMLDPYDDCLASKRPDELRHWGALAQAGLINVFHSMGVKADRGRWVDPPTVVILAGKDYIEPLLRWTFLRGRPVQTPLAGMGIGQRLSWLKRSDIR